MLQELQVSGGSEASSMKKESPVKILLQPERNSAAFYSLRNLCFHKNDFKTLSVITVNKMGF